MLDSFSSFISFENNELVPKHPPMLLGVVLFHYEQKDLNVADTFQYTAVIILIDAQIETFSSGINLFQLDHESF